MQIIPLCVYSFTKSTDVALNPVVFSSPASSTWKMCDILFWPSSTNNLQIIFIHIVIVKFGFSIRFTKIYQIILNGPKSEASVINRIQTGGNHKQLLLKSTGSSKTHEFMCWWSNESTGTMEKNWEEYNGTVL